MIKMENPSFCFSSWDVGITYKMWKNILGHKAMSPSELATVIVAANAASLGIWRKPLENIVLNVHGFPGGLHIGGMHDPDDNPSAFSMRIEHLGVFGVLKPLNVGTIWLVSCDAAQGPKGQSYCQTLAPVTGTQVIASDESQEVTGSEFAGLAFMWIQGIDGYIDDFEGTVYSFTPRGVMRKGIDPERDVWTTKE
jgi:Domain of unknown function (DUF4347)